MTYDIAPNLGETSALPAAAEWIAGLMLGPVWTAVGVIAVAWLGFTMLTGRTPLSQAMRVVLGLFILYGAPTIARNLANLARGGREDRPIAASPSMMAPPAPLPTAPAFDPYAGAAVPGQ
jgi:type IV secretory pathway VirB2 component (pilin)